MALSRFPQELIDIIVDNLHGDIPSLKSCSLVARIFVASARTHLFSKVEIIPQFYCQRFNTPPPSTCPKLFQLLTSSPHIAPFIKELNIVLMGARSDADNMEDRYVTWIMGGRTLSLVLSLLNLRRLSLVENSRGAWDSHRQSSMNWTTLGRQVREALAGTFSSQRLESVHLRGIMVESPRQLLSLFSEATSLRELSLSRVYFTKEDQPDPWPESQPWRPRLRSLFASDMRSDSFCRYLINSSIDLSGVRSLTIATESNEWRETLTRACGDVEHLRLRYSEIPDSLQPSFGTNLQTIHFFTVSTLGFMSVFFRSCLHHPRLKLITFEERDNENQIVEVHSSLNAAIDAAVVNLPSLKIVKIKRTVWRSSYPRTRFLQRFTEWSAAFRDVLPSLARRGLLRFAQSGVSNNGVLQGFE